MPKYPESYWRATVELPAFETLKEDSKADIVIVGGGITGITTGYLLQKEGFNVVILEAGRILNGTTGHTTAKITAQHDIIYDEYINHLGKEHARLYYEANMEALEFIKKTIEENNIECDFTIQDAIIYSTSEFTLDQLQTEAKAYEKLGIDFDFLDELPLNIEIKGALVMKNQAQFHPLLYLKHLVDDFIQRGGKIYENTTAIDVLEEFKPSVITREGLHVTADYVISCSHFPFYDFKGGYFARMYADRSYVIGVKTKEPYPGGMYLSADQPTRSLRSVTIDGEEIVLVGGESHKTGHDKNTMKHYEALEQFAKETLGIEKFLYRWSAQDLTTLDKLPYIGHITSNEPNIFVATGFRKWGMTTSTVAGLLLKDLIMKKPNSFAKVYDPSRFHADPSIRQFIGQNLDVAGHFIKGKIFLPNQNASHLKPGEGAIVRINGKRAGAYKDEEGKFHIVDTTCTHMGCELEWNNGEHTWDCPCHGSRFSIDGDVIEGPAERPLDKINVEELD
jgi:glycine/D-amino acid oxidase-like deaminating enzyme/nitrite reductase/ring-hydroxylating ferredoxin subunit